MNLKIIAEKENEQSIINAIKYQKNHETKLSIISEVDSISTYLQKIGFFLNSYEITQKKDSIYMARFSLGTKTEKAIIYLQNNFLNIPDHYTLKNDSLYIHVHEIAAFLNFVSENLEKDGKSFSEIKLENIKIIDSILLADLSLKESQQRKIDKIIINPYTAFPAAFLKHSLQLNKNSIFNQRILKQISKKAKALNFVSELKPPEVLFKKDSTLVYLYLKKNQNNSFDGLVNFATKENGGLLFNGYLDLKLNNVLNTGERFELFWNSIADEVQDFRISTAIPYIFSSPLSPEIAFNIYKQDSTFINTKFKSSISYSLNTRTNLLLSYNSENSTNLIDNSGDIQSFNNNFVGIGFNYQIYNDEIFFKDDLKVALHIEAGKRKTELQENNQLKLFVEASYIWSLNFRNSVFLRTETGYLNSDLFLTNELFRIGGATSIRGFNEQSIFTSKYSYFNSEYRYTTAQTSYLFSILDFGLYQTIQRNNEFLVGLGLGYSFTTNTNTFKLSYVVGKNQQTDFNVDSSKIIINWMVNF